ncbi:hypothetical protein [Dokdonella sp.]|uniref:hypothetical protein n=1 Tax=Dokdonella sp. TaxID=2291710 RepID=UPI0035283F7F
MSLIAELKRRNIVRASVAWLALSWLLVAIANLLFPAMDLPIESVRWLLLGLLAAWPLVLILAWRLGANASADSTHGKRIARRIDQASVVLVLGALSLSILYQVLQPYAAKRAARIAEAAVADASKAEVSKPAAAVAMPINRGAVDPRSIAVLPFANLSPDPEDAYFADGLAEELLNVLARIADLKVTSRSSSFAFRDSTEGAREIAGRLGVAHLLQGSVRRQGDDVRITAQLIDASDDRQIWSESYDRRISDIFQVQQEISQAIADTLADSLGVRTVEVAPATTDLQAYEWYLRGRQLFIQRGANLPAARELLERALAQDPRFADAWAALAGTWYVWGSYAPEPEGIDSLQRAAEAAAKSLELQPDHPGALAVSARLAAISGDRLLESRLIRRALELDPNNANTWLWQGLGLIEAGHIEAAHASFVQAQRLDPLSGLQLGWLGISTSLLGDQEKGEILLTQAHTFGWRGPASRALFLISLQSDDAAEQTQRYLDWLHDDETLPVPQRDLARTLAPAFADPDLMGSARQTLIDAAAAQPQGDWIVLLDVFGATEAAMDQALAANQYTVQSFMLSLWYPQFSKFRAMPRFIEFAERRGLLANWREAGPPDGCELIETPDILLDCDA